MNQQPTAAQALPLQGIRILDLTQVMFGPIATQVLGDFGAEIIKIEKPKGGDLSRGYDHFAKEDGGESAYFMAMNRNKRSLAIDLTKPQGLAIAKQIALRSDVLVHNFRPNVVERLGLDYDMLAKENPRLIHASGSGFGDSGPLAHKGGQDLLAQALSGIAFRNTDPSGQPQLFPTALGDYSAGMILAQGILLALFQRERTGVGQKVKVNLLDTLLAMQQQEVTQLLMRNQETNWLKQNPMWIFPTEDGHVVLVAAYRPNPISDLCHALAIDDITLQPSFANLAEQMKRRDELYAYLSKGFAKYTTQECLKRLDDADLLCAPVLSLGEATRHPQVMHNKTMIELDHPHHKAFETVGNVLRLSNVEDIAKRSPPMLGQHTEEILESLGYGADKREELRAAGIL